MKEAMTKILKWLTQSNRILHLLGGLLIGIGASTWYCNEYTSILVAGAMEFKDYQWGGKPDVVDFLLTVLGANVGYSIKYFLL